MSSGGEEDFVKALRATFKVEAAEHVQAIASGLLELEKAAAGDSRRRLVDGIFRAAHSLKGAARAVDFLDVESRCQVLEDMFAAWRTHDAAPPRPDLDDAHATLDAITASLTPAPAASQRPPTSPVPARPPRREPRAPAPADPGVSDESVRMPVSKLDAQLLQAEEMLAVTLMTERRAEQVHEFADRFDLWTKEWIAVETRAGIVRPALARMARTDPRLADELGRLLDFLDWNRDYARALQADLATFSRTADQDTLAVGKLVADLLEQSKTLLLLPFGTLAGRFPKLVRDLCRDQGKEADLVVSGEHIEIDKRILEEMKDPLVHLLRNCIDHGIETPAERERLGKPTRATIGLSARQINGSQVQLLVTDDGCGIDRMKVRAAALARGLLSPDDTGAVDDHRAAQLIFEPALSTSASVTRLSGRGLGLAIVREKAERLGGTVSVDSDPGTGARFAIVVPAMLATFRGILIAAGRQWFVVPTAQVERVTRVAPADIGTVEGRPAITLADNAVALARLQDVLRLPAAEGDVPGRSVTVIVVGAGDQRIAFAVDAVIDEREVLVKPLRKPLSRVRNIAGATVLPSGQVVPILHVPDLLRSAADAGISPSIRPPALPAARARRSVLVAEDSITSRMLLKGILESAGFDVSTAVDGMDAFSQLRTQRFDLLVSDVEMPRLDGFELTARVRADKRLAALPVILVTALATPEHRARGADAGANAYIVKSHFDQHDLLDAVRRLI